MILPLVVLSISNLATSQGLWAINRIVPLIANVLLVVPTGHLHQIMMLYTLDINNNYVELSLSKMGMGGTTVQNACMIMYAMCVHVVLYTVVHAHALTVYSYQAYQHELPHNTKFMYNTVPLMLFVCVVHL